MRRISLKISVLLGVGCLSPFIGYFNNTNLVSKESVSLGGISDDITVSNGGDWGGSAGSIKFTKITMPSGDTHGTAKLSSGMATGWKGSLIGQPTVSDTDGVFDVNEIGNVLAGNSNLTEIDLSKMNNLKMGSSCFAACSETYLNLSCTLAEGVGIPGSCFNNNTQLITADLTGVSTDSIGSAAFAGCSALENVDLSKMTSGVIGASGFYGCTSLENINLSSFNGTIAGHGFNGCTNLKQLEFSSMISGSFSTDSFTNCTSLDNITFGKCDPSEITFSDGWLNNTASGGVTINVVNEDLENWESLTMTSWGNTVTFVGYDLPVPPSPTANLGVILGLGLGLGVPALIGGGCMLLIGKNRKNKNETN